MSLLVQGFNAANLKSRVMFPEASFRLAIMADDNVSIYLSSPAGEKGVLLGSHSSLTSYKLLNLVNIPVYDNYTYFIARISNGSSYCGVNIRNAENQKCFNYISGYGWGGFGRPTTSWVNVGCWAICNIGAGQSVDWKIKVPMV